MKKLILTFTFLSIIIFSSFGQNFLEFQKVVASDRAFQDWFGYDVAMDGDWAVVSSPYNGYDASGSSGYAAYAGAAFIYNYDGTYWNQTQKIVASDRAFLDQFGFSVDISGDNIVVGAAGESSEQGAAYIFHNTAGVWSETQKITASDGASGDTYGISVAIDGTRIIVGAYQEDENASGLLSLGEAGSAYIYDLAGTWTETQKIVPGDRGADDLFGFDVDISGNYVVVGAYQEDENAFGTGTMLTSGSAYVFSLSGGVWSQQNKLVANDRTANDEFGFSVCIDGTRIMVGAHRNDTDENGLNFISGAGAVYLYNLYGASWLQTQKIVSGDRHNTTFFGTSIDIEATKMVVGAFQESYDENSLNLLSQAGAGYIFDEAATTLWSQVQKIVASDRTAGDQYGNSVAIRDSMILIGANLEGNPGTPDVELGAAYFLKPPPLPNINIAGIINNYAAVTEIDVCLNEMTVDDASLYSVGDSVLIIQMKGATMNLSNTAAFGDLVNLNTAGNYEYNTISAITGNAMTFTNGFQYAFDAAGSVQIVSIPNYTSNVTVTGDLTALPWDGTKGGILIFNATGDLILNGDIDVSGLGFRGGFNDESVPARLNATQYNYFAHTLAIYAKYYYINGTDSASQKGEGIVEYSSEFEAGKGKSLNGGGGGNISESGGGGGASRANGGNGGISDHPGAASPGIFGKRRGLNPGIGGQAIVDATRLFLGGGGGAAHGDNFDSYGGNGGGIIMINANAIEGNSNEILADGISATLADNDGGPGGGAGGTIYINTVITTNTSNITLSSNGGDGASVDDGTGLNTEYCHGPGGGGSGGEIRTSITTNLTTSIVGGVPGIVTNSTIGCNGSSKGATAGSNGAFANVNGPSLFNFGTPFLGVNDVVINDPSDTITVCAGNDAQMIIDTAGSVATTSFQWQILVGATWTDLSDGGFYTGTTSDVLDIDSPTSVLDGNDYRVLVYHPCDSAYSDEINLQVNQEAVINLQPIDTTVCIGNDGAFVVNASNVVSYQWQNNASGSFTNLVNNATYSGVTTDSLFINNVTATLDGVDFRLQMIDECGLTSFSNLVEVDPVTLIAINALSSDITICENEDTILFVTTSFAAATYTWQIQSGGSYSNLTNGTNYSNVTNDTLNLNNIPSSFNGNIYRVVVTDACGTTLNSSDIVFTVNSNSATTINDTICSNEMYTLPGGSMVNTANTYLDTIQNSNGCDSIVTTILVVNSTTSSTVNDTICSNGMYTLPNGQMVNTTGQYLDTLSNSNSCDSIITTNLQVLLSDSTFETMSSCIPADTGLAMSMHMNVNNCDSTHTIYTFYESCLNCQFSLGNDTSICDNDSLILSAAPNYQSYLWNDSSQNQTLTAFNPGLYFCEAVLFDTVNLITNGDFELGNSGFTSDYVYQSAPNNSAGQYTVANSPNAWNVNFDDCSDLTTGTGQMMIINGATTLNTNVWCQTINVIPNTDYAFSAYLSSLYAVDPANLQFSINGVLLGNIFSLLDTTCVWQNFYETWNSGINNVAQICIVNQTISAGGNDFAIDEISFTEYCVSSDSIIISSLPSDSTFAMASSCNPIDTGYNTTIHTNGNSCDSTHTIYTSLLPSSSTTVNDTICINEMYTLPDGSIVNTANTYIDTLQNSNTCDSIITTILVVNPTTSYTVNDTICSNEMYTLPGGSMVNTADVYIDTIQNANGCDSVITTNLVVNTTTSSTVNDTICSNEMYTLPGGLMVNITGVYLDTLQNSNSCDSVITTNLEVKPISITTVNDTICSNEMYTLPGGSMVNTSNTYLDTLQASNGCDSIITTNLVVNPVSAITVNDTICSNEMYTLPDGSMVNTANTYIDTLQNSNSCDSVITTNLVVNPTTSSIVNDTICSNEMYTLPDGSMVNTANTYIDTISNANGCDSVITTNLVVNAISATTVNDTICSNEMYTLPGGSMVNTSNTYLDTLQNGNSCDSVITTNLVVNPVSATTVNDTICSNEMYTLPDGSMVNTANTYIDTLQNSNSCDSVITTNLVVNAVSSSTVNDTICSNEMYTLPDGSMVNTANTYVDTLQNINGCDSVITTNLVVNPVSATTVNDTICSNEMYTLPDGSMVNTTDTYTDTLQNSNSCDSVITTNLVVNAVSATTVNDTICSNEMYTLPNGLMVNTASTYIDTLQNSNGCDSMITTNLVVNPTTSSTVNDTICSNAIYTLPDGSMVNTTGTYIDTLQNANSCDSVITTNLVVNPVSSSTVNDTICSNEMYTLPDGSMVNTTGTYLDTIPNSNLCDSLVIINLVVNSVSATTVNDTICSNEMYTLPDGSMVNITNTYVDTLQNSNSCDSVITTNLVVNLVSATTVNDTICSNEMYTLPDGSMVNTANTYIDTLQNSNSCDSVITTNLVVNPTTSSTVNDTICSNEMYTLPGGSMVNTANTYIDTIQNSNGCDSVITTNLVVNPISSSTVNDTICSNEMYTLPDGSMVNVTNTYLDTLQNSNGCDSVITTNLVVNQVSATTVNDTICSNEIYTLPDGSMVNTANTYIDTLQNSNSCDSIITTNLVVNPVSATTVNDTICSNEMYTLPDGSMVNTTNTYIDTLQNSNSCDSVITTNLVVNPTTSSTVNDTICSNEMYTLPSGSMVNTANTYIDTLQNSNGCDSVITTNLIVNPTTSSTVNDTICSNEMYILPSGLMVNIAGTYLDTLQNSNSCDSVITTNLVVNPVSATTVNDTICSNEMYTLPDGSMVNTANTYIDTLQNSNSCDSVITTNLVVNPTTTSTVNDTICANDMYTLPDGSMVNTAGIYLDTIPNSNGCDSVITTNLIVQPNINIVIAPSDLTVCEDSSAMFFVTATGTDVVYQWQVNNGMGFINISGETNDTLLIPNVTTPLDMNGFEFRVVLNSYCANSIVSDSAVLSVTYNTALTTNSVDAVICEGSDTSYTVTSNGNEISIQWQVDNGAGFVNVVNGTNYNGANTLSLNLVNVPFSFDGNTYRIILSDNCGFADTSVLSNLTVNPLAVITAQENDLDICSGSDATFYVTATNATSFQWQINVGLGFVNMPGETNDSLILTGVTPAMDGNLYLCLVTNPCTNLTSTSVTLTVSEIAVVISEPTDVVICPEGPGFNFDLTFDAINITSYQWQINTGAGYVNVTDVDNFSGSNTGTLTVTVPFDNVDGANFRLVYTDDCGNGVISNEYSVNVNEPNPVNGIEDITYCQREIGIIEVDYDGTDYVWDDANQTAGRFIVPEESGDYIVTFRQNSSSCLAMDTINVVIEDCVEQCIVTAPTGFSPNGTGVNDVFRAIYTCDLDFFELMIVNRWGELVFYSDSPEIGWDGTYKNKPAPIDSYAWYIKYNKVGESKQQDVSGNLTIIR